MRRDLTTRRASHQTASDAADGAPSIQRDLGFGRFLSRQAAGSLWAALLGACFILLVYQVPAVHTVDLGHFDSAYVQGFGEPETGNAAYLLGSSGTARWSGAVSYLIFPQIGLPAEFTIRLRGWRTTAPPPQVTLLLNGRETLGQITTTGEWEEHHFTVRGGWLKSSDVLIEIRSDVAALTPEDARQVGVLVDQASLRTTAFPILPYPPQIAFGALAAVLLQWLLWGCSAASRWRRPWVLPALVAALALAFLLLYRLQLSYPYPLRQLLPLVCLGLGAALLIRDGAAWVRHWPRLLDLTALLGIAGWFGAILLASQQHLVLSTPGVEKDFRVFALRSERLFGAFPAGTTDAAQDGVLRADGFYNLGYPLLLWAVRPFTSDNPFLAGRLIAACSGALLLLAAWGLARRWLGSGAALIALLSLAFSGLVVQYSLYLGTDMPFAAACTLALLLLCRRPIAAGGLAAAGAAVGLAFLFRHPGLALLPLGWLLLSSPFWQRREAGWQRLLTRRLLIFTLAFLLIVAPQLWVNLRDTGSLFYNRQAENVWLGVFAGGDWGRAAEIPTDVSLLQTLAADPGRFFANWIGNLLAFFGTGAEDSSEFGRAIQLHLLNVPANWLALAGLLGWLALLVRRFGKQRLVDWIGTEPPFWLLLWIGLSVASVSLAFVLPRFFLPLAPVYALAAAWAVAQLPRLLKRPATGWQILVGVLLLVSLWGGLAGGANYVLRERPSNTAPGQSPTALAAVQLIEATLQPQETILIRVPSSDADMLALSKYSAIAHRTVAAPSSDDLAALQASGATYLLWSAALNETPFAVPVVAQLGSYTLYRLVP